MINQPKWWLPLFIAMFVAQLAIPAYMVYQEERVVSSGKLYKFKTAAVDPADPFRGRYLTLRFAANQLEIDSFADFKRGQKIYIQIQEDNGGFVEAKNVSPNPFEQGDYVQAKVTRFHKNPPYKVFWEYGFNRYYMQEFQSLKAEDIHRHAVRDTNSISYAKVMVKNGKSTLTDVIVNDTSIVTLSRITE